MLPCHVEERARQCKTLQDCGRSGTSFLISLRGVVQLLRTPACHAGGRGAPAIFLLRGFRESPAGERNPNSLSRLFEEFISRVNRVTYETRWNAAWTTPHRTVLPRDFAENSYHLRKIRPQREMQSQMRRLRVPAAGHHRVKKPQCTFCDVIPRNEDKSHIHDRFPHGFRRLKMTND
jgi:hypothetical protein